MTVCGVACRGGGLRGTSTRNSARLRAHLALHLFIMYHREYPITPSQQATNGALSIFVEGCQKGDMRQQLFGLSVLRGATEAQVHAAMPFVQGSQRVTLAEIRGMLTQ
jgi:hypothetical protein